MEYLIAGFIIVGAYYASLILSGAIVAFAIVIKVGARGYPEVCDRFIELLYIKKINFMGMKVTPPWVAFEAYGELKKEKGW